MNVTNQRPSNQQSHGTVYRNIYLTVVSEAHENDKDTIICVI